MLYNLRVAFKKKINVHYGYYCCMLVSLKTIFKNE